MKGHYLALYDEVIRRGAELSVPASNSKSFSVGLQGVSMSWKTQAPFRQSRARAGRLHAAPLPARAARAHYAIAAGSLMGQSNPGRINL